jgi:hypothetical protein
MHTKEDTVWKEYRRRRHTEKVFEVWPEERKKWMGKNNVEVVRRKKQGMGRSEKKGRLRKNKNSMEE